MSKVIRGAFSGKGASSKVKVHLITPQFSTSWIPGCIDAQVIEFSKFHVEANKKVDEKPAKSDDDIKAWDAEFVKVDQATLFDLILVRICFWLAGTNCILLVNILL